MTEKEIEKQAEEYAKHNATVINNARAAKSIYDDREEIKQAFQNGAKWGMEHSIKWHEIRCCSQDLPPRSKDNHLHSAVVSNEFGEPIYYDFNIEEWCDMEGDVVSEGYKYWCELPQLKE